MGTDWIEIKIPDDGVLAAYLCTPEGTGGPWPAIVVCHELFGVNADIRTVAETLAANGFLAVAPQFYHRTAGTEIELTRDDAGRDRGFAHLHQLTREQALADVGAVLEYLAGRDDTAGVGLLGFSAGGHLAFLAATALPVTATAVLYGGWLTTTGIPLSRPEPTLTLATGIAEQRGSLLYLVGEQDTLIQAAEVAQIRAGLRAAGVPHEVVVYPRAQHAYFWPGTAGYDEPATANSWQRLLAFFGKHLRPG